MRRTILALVCCLPIAAVTAEEAKPDDKEAPLQPSWETQREARMWMFAIPAPRGQITDRKGIPFAQTRVGQQLALRLPSVEKLTDAKLLQFARQQAKLAEVLLDREITFDEKTLLKHYKNRARLPYSLIQDLLPNEIELIRRKEPKHLELKPTYVRFYPNGHLAGHVIGYCGRQGRALTGPVQNSEFLWPESEGREGLEKTFNTQLTGRPGQLNMAFDAQGNLKSERVSFPPEPGFNIITTLDEGLQRKAESLLEENAERGAIVLIDPHNGDILALASWPVLNPNLFVPFITAGDFSGLRDDPDLPLLPRAFRAAYPPGSVFKIFVGLASMEGGFITNQDKFGCPPSMTVGGLVFRNWKKKDAGFLNFREALTQSCNTWFYQVAIRTGSAPITDWAYALGLGKPTALPLSGESKGRVPDADYMKKVYGRPPLNGDLANLGIGQGDTLVTPVQMAYAMGAIANGGALYQPRLVMQVQDAEGKVLTAYEARARNVVSVDPQILSEVREAMVDVVSSGMGTAARARVDDIRVAGKTGTAQWGPKENERTAAWFAGFAPADNPTIAFAAVYEGGPNDSSVHGGSHAAPMIGDILRDLYSTEKAQKAEAVAPEVPEGEETEPGTEEGVEEGEAEQTQTIRPEGDVPPPDESFQQIPTPPAVPIPPSTVPTGPTIQTAPPVPTAPAVPVIPGEEAPSSVPVAPAVPAAPPPATSSDDYFIRMPIGRPVE